MTHLIVDMSPNPCARIAGAAYIGVTILFYFLFKPVHKGLYLLAAVLSFAGLASGLANDYVLLPGITAETGLCLWLLVMDVDVAKWRMQANA